MGNQLSGDNSPPKQLFQRYQMTDKNEEKSLFYLTHLRSQRQYIMRELTVTTQIERSNINLLTSQKLSSRCQHMIELYQKLEIKNEGYCSDQFKFYLIFERPYKTLRDEIHYRKSKNRIFTEDQLISLLKTCVYGLKFLKQINHSHENVSSDNIFISKQGEFFLSDPWLNFQPHIFPQVNHQYYSPEKMEVKNNFSHQIIDWYASDLFSLGLVILETIYLDYMDNVYNQKEIVFLVLNQKINNVQSSVIKKWLKGLLERSPENRISIVKQIQMLTQGSYRKNTLNRQYEKIEKDFTIKSASHRRQTKPFQHQKPVQKVNDFKKIIEVQEVIENVKSLQQTKPTLSDTTKSNKCNIQSQSINIIIDYKSITNSKSDNQKNKPIEGSFIKVEQNIQVYVDRNTNVVEVVSEEEPVNESEYRLLTYDSEQPVNSSTNFEDKKKSPNSQTFAETKVEQEQQEKTPAKKSTKKQKYNSTIVEVSDSQNNSGGQQPQNQLVIEKYQIGSTYEGHKKNGMRNGKGKFSYHDGGYYEGMWKNDKMNGQGKLYYPSGQLAYEGQWKQDQFHGYGKVYNDSPTPCQSIDHLNFNTLQQQWQFYQGNLKSDTKQGSGRIKFSNGQIFQGQFMNDKMNGEGKFYKKDGTVIKALWKNSKLVVTL